VPQPIVIVDYDPEWTAGYKEEASKILGAIGDKVVAVEHIGSTAVPGLGAKPIIDIMLVVGAISDAHKCITPLRCVGVSPRPSQSPAGRPQDQLSRKNAFRLQWRHRHRSSNRAPELWEQLAAGFLAVF